MKFIVFNGSPKSDKSITLQSFKYLEKRYNSHEFEIINIAKSINSIEQNRSELITICEKVSKCDGVIWSYPIYCGHVPYNLRRFIEILIENNMKSCFKNKYTTSYSTSIHYYDHTAHNYIHAICNDLEMNYINSLSQSSDDLLGKNGQKQLEGFFEMFTKSIDDKIVLNPSYNKITPSDFVYTPTLNTCSVKTNKKIYIITDSTPEDGNLNNMIGKYKDSIDGDIKEINLNNISIKSSCLGCCRCGYDNTCIIRDDFKGMYDELINYADIIIYAFNMKDRFLSSKYSLMINRGFVYNHVPVLKGKQIGFIISGKINEDFNTKQLLSESNSVYDIASDECEDSTLLDRGIENFAKMGINLSEAGYFSKENFLGVAAKKLFADEIGNSLSGIFLADYEYFKKNNYFPKKGVKDIIEKVKGAMFRFMMKQEKIREAVHKDMIDHMVNNHLKVVKEV